jgi:anhydro-N-acetylmuramic acid kinase
MANVTWVPRRGLTQGAFAFDTGPGVAVIDAITRRIDPDAGYDRDGERARRGRPAVKLLEELLADPYFSMAPPKSTGRERFGIEYADTLLARVRKAGGTENDAIATATALTVESIGRAIGRWGGEDGTAEVVISGGGAKNPALVDAIAAALAPLPVRRFDAVYYDGEAKEAVAFALLGYLHVRGLPGNIPTATGARGPRVLGKRTPAGAAAGVGP